MEEAGRLNIEELERERARLEEELRSAYTERLARALILESVRNHRGKKKPTEAVSFEQLERILIDVTDKILMDETYLSYVAQRTRLAELDKELKVRRLLD